MPVWNLGPVREEPGVRLTSWRIFEANAEGPNQPATLHFVGRRHGSTFRVSSPVQTIDVERRRGLTESGNVYELVGLPCPNTDAENLWVVWARRHRVSSWLDVTAEVFPALAAAAGGLSLGRERLQ